MPGQQCIGDCGDLRWTWTHRVIFFLAPAVFAVTLLLVFFICYYHRWRQLSNSRGRPQSSAVQRVDMSPERQGLSQSFRKRLPIFLFDEARASTLQSTDCAVCLNDYQLNEKLSELPSCKHSFHSQCVDVWLQKNTTCPVCRNSLVQKSPQYYCEQAYDRDTLSIWNENSPREEGVSNEVQDGSPFDKHQEASSSSGVSGDHGPAAVISLDRSS